MRVGQLEPLVESFSGSQALIEERGDLLEVLPQGVARLTASGGFRGGTAALEAQLGHPEGSGWEPPPGGLVELLHPDDREAALAALAKAADPDGGWVPYVDSIDTRIMTASGSYRWFELRAMNALDAHGVIVVTFSDVETRVSAADFQNRWLRTCAHELRAPIAASLGRLDIIEASLSAGKLKVPATVTESLDHLRAAAMRQMRLVNDLSDSARMESGEFELVLEDGVDVGSLVRAEVEALRVEADGKGIDISLMAPPGIRIKADAARFSQALYNWLSNAVRYSREGGAVAVTVSTTRSPTPYRNAFVKIRVVDTGIGMSVQDLEALGTLLWRSDSARGHAVGTGLGFAVAKGIAEAHRGFVSVESSDGSDGSVSGTSVVVSVPLGA